MHTLFLTDDPLEAATYTVEGDEAKHALRVKRLGVGDRVRVLNGRGAQLICLITAADRSMRLRVEERSAVPRLVPALHLFTATPKGPRLDKMIDQLSQVAVASWTPLDTALGVVEPGENKIDRIERIAIESAKQCGREWTMEVGHRAPFDTALAGPTHIVLAHEGAPPYSPTGAQEIRVLIGPEGGFTEAELARARSAGARLSSFGPHVMRIETAAVAAAAIVLNAERSTSAG